VLTVGGNKLVCEHPAADALAELERSPCEPVRPDEVIEPPEPDSAAAPETETPPPAEERPAPAPASAPMVAASSSRGWGLTDAAVVVLALSVLATSIAGLVWLLGHR
jgi:hypothetical protein